MEIEHQTIRTYSKRDAVTKRLRAHWLALRQAREFPAATTTTTTAASQPSQKHAAARRASDEWERVDVNRLRHALDACDFMLGCLAPDG
eukprot:COSAG06_NODE_27017_length_603_cov_0.587302_2_plen_88_part_01